MSYCDRSYCDRQGCLEEGTDFRFLSDSCAALVCVVHARLFKEEGDKSGVYFHVHSLSAEDMLRAGTAEALLG